MMPLDGDPFECISNFLKQYFELQITAAIDTKTGSCLKDNTPANATNIFQKSSKIGPVNKVKPVSRTFGGKTFGLSFSLAFTTNIDLFTLVFFNLNPVIFN